jgi:catechol 2,3-dioxygenase
MSTLQTSTPATLHHLDIGSDRPDALARFYREQFGMEESRSGSLYVLRGGTRALIVRQGRPEELRSAGYALQSERHLQLLRARLLYTGVEPEPVANPLFRPGAFEVHDPQGRITCYGVPLHERTDDAMPARLQHTVFQTTELDAVVRFYVEKIGFAVSDEVIDHDGTIMVVFLRSDDEHHTLAFFRGGQNAWDHHCYETREWNNIRDWGDKFARQHIPIFFGPGRHGPGNNLFFMVNDPDGNRLEFSAEMQRVAAETIPGVWPHGEYTLNSWGRAWIRS